MNLKETMQFLGVVSAVDNRRADRNVGVVWQEILKDVPLSCAMQAHTTFRRTHPGVYLEPGHIYQDGIRIRDYNRVRVQSAKALGLLDESVDRDFALDVPMLSILSDYEKVNDRALMGVISNEDADARLRLLREAWVATNAHLMPRAVEQ
jgi:hypothetical protein